MEKNIVLRYPKYLKEFKCIGGKCSDSCCIGWDVDIDKSSFRQYYKVKDAELKRMFQKNLKNNDYCQCDDVDYGKVKLKEGKRCPFLDEENYCVIHSKLGEEYLSNVCTSFPRILNIVDNHYEMSLDVSCPEVAKILLMNKDSIKFHESEEVLGKHIVSSVIDTKEASKNKISLKYFNEIREKSLEIIMNRSLEFSERMYILGEFINALEEELDNNFNNVNKFIEKFDINYLSESFEGNDINYALQVDFFKKIITVFDIDKLVDSNYFREYTKEVIAGYEFEDGKEIGLKAGFYIDAYKEYNEYLKENDYIFENYFANFIYNYLFPFSENSSVFDGYIMLAVRYAFIKFFLVGRYLYNKKESVENIVNFIQGFTKCIGHHNSYLVDLLGYIKMNEFNNMEFIKMIL